jgi:hypothetical protein
VTTEFWNQYAYARPVAEKLTASFGVSFALENTGGGCICIVSGPLEGNVYVVLGSGVDGPLSTAEDRNNYAAEHNGNFDGWGVGVYDHDTGHGRADVSDALAGDDDVVEMIRRALATAAAQRDPDRYPSWRRDATGKISEGPWPK